MHEDLIGTFCIVNNFDMPENDAKKLFNRNILYCKFTQGKVMSLVKAEFNRNILYCKLTKNPIPFLEYLNLIGTFCIVNLTANVKQCAENFI